MGTIVVNLPAVAATTPSYTTILTLPGVTPNHAIQFQDMGVVSGASANAVGSTARILQLAQPQQGQVTLTFINQGAAANATDRVFSYVATPLP